VRITDTGSAAFLVYRRLGGGRASKTLRRSIGSAWRVPLPPGLDPPKLTEVRTLARQAIADLAAGLDPKEKQAQARREEERRRADTFAGVFERFQRENLAKLRSGRAVALAVRKHAFPAWSTAWLFGAP
jgi:hypothetical protein